MAFTQLIVCFVLSIIFQQSRQQLDIESESFLRLPIVISTWRFENATKEAWKVIKENRSALDAIEAGCTVCEKEQCDGTVGFGGSPDERGETTLDAMMMDGRTMNVGAVASMRRVKSAISVARAVLEHTAHSLLVGNSASQFALQMGFKEETLATNKSTTMFNDWKKRDCQPNFWLKVSPDPESHCGPYTRNKNSEEKLAKSRESYLINNNNHDTIGMVAIDKQGNIAAGTSTNGANHKIAGRVGDSPIPGSGAYADNNVGAAAATGDGDVMLRFLPSFLAVEEMRRGASPEQAALTAVHRIAEYYPLFSGAVIAVNKNGDYGVACHGLGSFPFSLSYGISKVKSKSVICDQISVKNV